MLCVKIYPIFVIYLPEKHEKMSLFDKDITIDNASKEYLRQAAYKFMSDGDCVLIIRHVMADDFREIPIAIHSIDDFDRYFTVSTENGEWKLKYNFCLTIFDTTIILYKEPPFTLEETEKVTIQPLFDA